jgi:hypothetical protein
VEKDRWEMMVDDKCFDYTSTYDEELETWLFLDACEPVPESLSCTPHASWLADGTFLKLSLLAVTKWKPRWRIGEGTAPPPHLPFGAKCDGAVIG